ncbi:hypothetical protein ACMZOO_02720 [Catenovulum sp. SX2]|uniref:hypothetical protein n=1 Tax=Catenovulum sp. SX2 TaxID=3398614 RepID=UPI003F86F5F1
MARKNSLWQKNKYWLNAWILVLPAWFFYQSLYPTFPDALGSQQVGNFEITLMPYDEDAPYTHDGVYVKDFLLTFSKGQIGDIKQAYLNIGEHSLPLEQFADRSEGILHGTKHGQHVHALAKQTLLPSDKIWLTMQTWSGESFIASWEVPKHLVAIN